MLTRSSTTHESRPPRVRIATVALLGALLVACGDDRNAYGGADSTAAAGTLARPAATDETKLQVTGVELGRSVGADNRINDGTSEFTPNEPVTAVVETDGSGTGQVIVARWLRDDDSLVEEQTQAVSSTGGKSFTQFRLSPTGGLIPGKYKVRILVANEEVASEAFEVKRDR